MALKAVIHFFKCIQDSQDYGSDVEHMVSRVFFSLRVGNKTYPNLSANIRQAYGGNYSEDPIEVDRPEGYDGPLNFEAYRAAAERYYRKATVGDGGRMIHIPEGSNVKNLVMRNNVTDVSHTEGFDIEEGSPAW